MHVQEQQNCALMDCYAAKVEIDSGIVNWKTSFRPFSKDTSTIGQVSTKFAKIAKAFADNHYYQCEIPQAFKALKSSVEKTAKEKRRQERMDTNFEINEQSIKDIV